MKREDLRSRIIPTTIGNTDESQNMGNNKFDTTDLIYLDSYDEQYDGQKTNEERKISATDYAKMNNAYTYGNYKTHTGRPTAWTWLRSAFNSYFVHYVRGDGDRSNGCTDNVTAGLCPSLHYHLPSDISAGSVLRFFKGQKNRDESKELEFDIREIKDIREKTIYHTLQIGEYPKTKVDENLSQILESLYHRGKLKETEELIEKQKLE